MITAKESVVAALKLMGIVNSYGYVDENKCSRYFGVAPAYLNILVCEIAAAENAQTVPSAVQTPDSTLDISDDSATRVLPFRSKAAAYDSRANP